MRGAAMSFTAAASGLVVFLLSVSVVQSQYGMTYSSTKICAVKGSTVEIRCSYTYPSTSNGHVNTVEKTCWFTTWKDLKPVDVTTDSEYAGRVEDLCENNTCTLRIKNLTESDSVEYWFSIKTRQYTHLGVPGTTLSVTDAPKPPSVSVSPSAEIEEGSSVTLTCSSDANPAANYTWYKEDGNADLSFVSEGPRLFLSSIQSSDSGQYYCTADNLLGSRRSEPIFIDVTYAPKLPSVSVSPPAEIEEGSSVTLTCSSDANPAANYTWYKMNGNRKLPPLTTEPKLFFSSFQVSDSGKYYCRADNLLGSRRSESISIDVKYAPKLPSVSVSPSAEIKEGRSVTLTCSSDANPAANYTWYKEDEDSLKASGQIFTITDFRAEHSGSYSCGAQNKLGRSNSTLTLIVVAGSSTMTVNIIGTTLGVLMLILVFLLSLWMRKKKALHSTTEAHEPVEIETLT
ncbi:B-cell receptor CD22-like [Pseudochaenichthys georgianus]|uniref:B-cell receptor CD22-like n=1 Tax=Pseudochaenichthys georgianus TaxID=52239 RepID=UPI001469A0E3|nr:B-cell receptor CD22-like [Pseudochaenichthys georgianus]